MMRPQGGVLRSILLASMLLTPAVAPAQQADSLVRIVGATPRIAARLAIDALAGNHHEAAARWADNLARMGVPIAASVDSAFRDRFGDSAAARWHAVATSHSADTGASSRYCTFAADNLLPEEIAWDGARQRWLATSVLHGEVYAFTASCQTTVVVPAAALPWGTFALLVDSTRDRLWVTSISMPGSARYSAADSGRSTVFAVSLRSGKIEHRYTTADTARHALGDMAIAPDGTVYLSDALGGGVYRIAPRSAAIDEWLPPGTFSSPQTPALSANGRTLYVPDYRFGIAAVDVATHRWRWLRHADSVALTGIDGLYTNGHSLIAVQNGLAPNRIVQVALNASGEIGGVRTLVRGAGASDISHAEVRNAQLVYIANSGWDRMGDDGVMAAAQRGVHPELRTVSLRRVAQRKSVAKPR